ncbi:MAG: M24 family metallopeptidase [Planctomycetes bacterium]|nr:M24 family metallopeptidase [Planctomycetota bacterium]
MAQSIRQERQEKLHRVRAYMRGRKLDVVLLTTRTNFSWLTAGSLNHVAMATSEGVTTLAVTPRSVHILANAIEAPRMMAEELAAEEFRLVEFPWHDDASRRAAVMDLAGGRKKAAADTDLYGLPRLDADFAELRYSMTEGEIARYRKLGRDVSEILETVCAEIEPGETEWQVDGLLAELSLARGIRPFVRLVAADRRIERFRHPISTPTKIRRQAMVVTCGERHGLVVAASRLVNFGSLSKALRRKHQAVCNIDAALILASRPGTAIGDVLAKGIEAYAAEGFADQWQLHHQGGPTGYLGREFIATPGERRRVQVNQPFAWNPSITGTKSEDTVLATEKGPELLSRPIDWPTVEGRCEAGTVVRADILVR